MPGSECTALQVHARIVGLKKPEGAWVSMLALAETTWALDTVYARKPAQIALAIEMLLNHQHLVPERADVVAAALAHYRAKASPGFSHCLMLETARASGHLPLGTFYKLGRLEGTQLRA